MLIVDATLKHYRFNTLIIYGHYFHPREKCQENLVQPRDNFHFNEATLHGLLCAIF